LRLAERPSSTAMRWSSLLITLVLLSLSIESSLGKLRRTTQHVYRNHHGQYPLVRRANPDVIAERELEAGGRFGAEQAILLPHSNEPLLVELQNDRGRRAEALTHRVFSHEHDPPMQPFTPSHIPIVSVDIPAAPVNPPRFASLSSSLPLNIPGVESSFAAAFQAASRLPPPPAVEAPPASTTEQLQQRASTADSTVGSSGNEPTPSVFLEQEVKISRSLAAPGLPTDMPPGLLTVGQRMAMPQPPAQSSIRALPMLTPQMVSALGPTMGMTPAMQMATQMAPFARFAQQQRDHAFQMQLRQHHSMQLAQGNQHPNALGKSLPQTGQFLPYYPSVPQSTSPRFVQRMTSFIPPYSAAGRQAAYPGGQPPLVPRANTPPAPPPMPDLPPPPVGIY